VFEAFSGFPSDEEEDEEEEQLFAQEREKNMTVRSYFIAYRPLQW
jgi:hypothetical protein